MRANLRVGMPLIVDHLVFVGDWTIAVFDDEILDAAVGAGRDRPLKRQLEVVECVDGDDVASALRVLPATRMVDEPSAFHGPSAGGEGLLLETAPTLRRYPVEQQTPAGLLFGRRELRRFRPRRGLRTERHCNERRQREGAQNKSHHVSLLK